jgi:hypothetical protein
MRGHRTVISSGALLLGLLCSGCAPPIHIDDTNRQQTSEDFVHARIELADSLATTGSFTSNRPKMHSLYLQGDWQGLSRLVIEVNFDNDLDWFYLGRAAEGMQLNDTALYYYARALSTINACYSSVFGDACDGLRFPQDITARVNALHASRK